MAITDHGNVTGSVAVDASTSRIHHFNLTDDDTVIEEPSGMSDGDVVTLIYTCTGWGNHYASHNFNANNTPTPNPNNGNAIKVTLMKFGSKWI